MPVTLSSANGLVVSVPSSPDLKPVDVVEPAPTILSAPKREVSLAASRVSKAKKGQSEALNSLSRSSQRG